ncbi:50S ribosomal protein L15 [Candidatus Saccharibacteria bacterium]|nr:50S ribosomal protein L15 [Candidatus Saccharibacteria bacterium]
MKYHELKISSNRAPRRVGRGIAAGQGKTAGRGTKGQKSRAGSSRRPGFEGGQTPLMQRLPKLPGFRAIRPKLEVIYTGQLDKLGPLADNHTIFKAGLTSSPYVRVKLIVNGAVTKKVTVKLQAASRSAAELVKQAGGSFETTPQVGRSAKTSVKK